jgi:hypothetical protein
LRCVRLTSGTISQLQSSVRASPLTWHLAEFWIRNDPNLFGWWDTSFQNISKTFQKPWHQHLLYFRAISLHHQWIM